MFWLPTPLCYLEEMQFLHNIYYPSSHIEKFQDCREYFFFEKKVLNTYIPLLSSKMQFFPISIPQVVRFQKFQVKRVFLKRNVLSTTVLCYLKKCILPHISSPCSGIWKFWQEWHFQDSWTPNHGTPNPLTWTPCTWTPHQTDNLYEQ